MVGLRGGVAIRTAHHAPSAGKVGVLVEVCVFALRVVCRCADSSLDLLRPHIQSDSLNPSGRCDIGFCGLWGFHCLQCSQDEKIAVTHFPLPPFRKQTC